MKRIKYTKELLEPLVKDSKSIAEILRKLGLSPKGGSFKTVQRHIINFNINTDHMTGQAWSKGQTKLNNIFVAKRGNKIATKTIENSLILGTHLTSVTLHRLYSQVVTDKKCVKCGTGSVWMNEPISLHIDHINGNSFDNRIENLRYLCPNCHSQTDTFCAKNRHAYRQVEIIIEEVVDDNIHIKLGKKSKQPNLCKNCNLPVSNNHKHCSYECAAITNRKLDISDEELYTILTNNKFNYLKTAREVGLSDNGVRKRIKKYMKEKMNA